MALATVVLTQRSVEAADEAVPAADALVKYAESLGKTGEAVTLGPDGLTIQGSTLKGSSVVRPSVALSRAAELYAEAAGETNNTKILKKALDIWKVLNDPRSPVGFLRQYSQTKKSQNPAFATYCTVMLANCYCDQGDKASAETLLAPYLSESSSVESPAFAKATYAGYLLGDGEIDKAREIAQDVAEKVPRPDFSYVVSDAYTVSLNVLAAVPYLSKAGSVTATSNEAKILKDIEGNPRRYWQLAQIVYAAGDKQKAISYWDEYRKRFPTEEIARYAAMSSAKAYEELKKPDKAIEYYSGISIQYPDYPEGWQASLRAATLLNQSKRFKEALDLLEKAGANSKSAQGKASILAAQAQLLAQNQMLDESAEKYMGLLIKYGDQDAAKDAINSLRKIIPQVKKWKYFTQAIQNWLSGKYGRAGQVGGSQLNLSDASQMRRLALSFYVENNDVNGGIAWLKALGMKSEEKERNWYIRDEAWLDSQMAQKPLSNTAKAPRQDISNAVKLGLSAWKIAPDTEEGLAGLKASGDLAARPGADKTSVRQFIKELENLRGGDSDALIVEMLVPLYETVGDQKSLKEIRESAQQP
jgi:tetratricopeptide (TPR) repeat protein